MYSHLDILYLYSWSSKWKSLHVKTYTYTIYTHTHQSPHVSLRLRSDLGRRAKTMQKNCTQERTRQGTAEAWKNTSSGKFHVAFYVRVWKVLDGTSPTAILKFQNASTRIYTRKHGKKTTGRERASRAVRTPELWGRDGTCGVHRGFWTYDHMVVITSCLDTCLLMLWGAFPVTSVVFRRW